MWYTNIHSSKTALHIKKRDGEKKKQLYFHNSRLGKICLNSFLRFTLIKFQNVGGKEDDRKKTDQ